MSATTITFGDVAENHAGMQKIGTSAKEGLTIDELYEAAKLFDTETQIFDLVQLSGITDVVLQPAALLVVRGGVWNLESLNEELDSLEVDKKAFMYGRVVNKLARHNLCFSDEAQEPNYAEGKGRVVAFQDVPMMNTIRSTLRNYFGEKARSLQAEGNFYYDVKKCGIGFHGDGERNIVIAIRLGDSIPLHYQWYYRNKPIGKRIIIDPPLQNGDMYVMSEKAVGNDWKRSSIPTLRHAAGSAKFLDMLV